MWRSGQTYSEAIATEWCNLAPLPNPDLGGPTGEIGDSATLRAQQRQQIEQGV